MKKMRLVRWTLSILAAIAALPVMAVLTANYVSHRAIGGDGAYFVNDFEDNVPLEKSSADVSINVEGEGEWIFSNSFASTNTSYVVLRSIGRVVSRRRCHTLRMIKHNLVVNIIGQRYLHPINVVNDSINMYSIAGDTGSPRHG